MGALVPHGFEAYARLLHPASRDNSSHEGSPVRWSEIAARNGRAMHPLVQFERIAGAGLRRDAPLWDRAPLSGHLPAAVVDHLVPVLREGTSRAETCWFAVWYGYGGMPETEGFHGAPTFARPGRGYYLLRGDIGMSAAMARTWPHGHGPSLWWPDNRAWCVASEIDLDSTYIGGSADCIARLLAHPGLGAFPAALEDDVSAASDTLNP
ncbi:MAG: hypothetical protein H0V71_02630 [Chloroflexi bacterium]|nr:hypothetical protein [Chloroflexota bacterium]